jgi:hypothetical protein
MWKAGLQYLETAKAVIIGASHNAFNWVPKLH